MKAMAWLVVGLAVDALPDWAYWRWMWVRRLAVRAAVGFSLAESDRMARRGKRKWR